MLHASVTKSPPIDIAKEPPQEWSGFETVAITILGIEPKTHGCTHCHIFAQKIFVRQFGESHEHTATQVEFQLVTVCQLHVLLCLYAKQTGEYKNRKNYNVFFHAVVLFMRLYCLFIVYDSLDY